MHSALSTWKTTRRNSGAVALYMWMVAVLAPTIDSAVRSIRSSRAWVSTETVTSSGIRSSLDQLADEVEVGLAGGGKSDLDLLVAHPHQQVEHLVLAGRGHRVDQRLVAVAQIGGQPARRPGDHFAGQVRSGRSIGVNGA